MSRQRSETNAHDDARPADPSLKPRIRFLIDENVPLWVADELKAAHHETVHVSDLLLLQSPDEVIAMAGNDLGAVLVTRNYKDFKEVTSRRLPKGSRTKMRNLGVVSLECNETKASELARVKHSLELIELEHNRRLTAKDRRLFIEIKQHSVTIQG